MFELRTFGGLSLSRDGTRLTGAPARPKTLALLALLAASPKGVRRDKLLNYLWPDANTTNGRHLLKQACYALRQDLHPDVLIGRSELQIDTMLLASDIRRFDEAAQQKNFVQMAELYVGPFLDGFYLDGSDEFEHWAEAERERIANQVRHALERLATEATARGDQRASADWWRRLAVLEPLSSRAALGVMTALAALGESAMALRHGRAYEALVRRELGTRTEPAVETLISRLQAEPTAAEGVSTEELRRAAAAVGERRTVGYERERTAMRTALQTAMSGRGLMLCVAGEPGSGKTTLVEDFLSEVVASGRPCHIARGRCSERLAGSGAYLPLLDALEGLLRADSRGVIARLMRDLAPNWNAQVSPALQATSASAATQVQAASQERMKRELNAFLREVSRLRPLVMFLDDVHWVDASTVDVLGYVAAQMGTAQMVIVTTYRPSELQLARHPFGSLKLDLQARGFCRELPLELLTSVDIDKFLTFEFAANSFPETFGEFVHAKTEGNPLFMVDLLRYLRARDIIVSNDEGWLLNGSLPDLARELPESVRSMIERKIEQLSDKDLELLLVAGVQGYECDAAIIARVLSSEPGFVEQRLQSLERVHGFVRQLRQHRFPDGTLAVRYRFVHVLYQNALYARLTFSRRAALSRAVAEALLAHYGDRSAEVAAEVAVLFDAAQDPVRAVEYFALAAERATAVFANQEAATLAERGLAQLAKLPESAVRTQQELRLQVTLAFSLLSTAGYGAPETGAAMARAQELCESLGNDALLAPVRVGLWAYYICRGNLQAARELGEQLISLSRDSSDRMMQVAAHTFLGATLHHQGEMLASRELFEHAAELYDRADHARYVELYRLDPGIYAASELARTLWFLGYPDQAREQAQKTIRLARELGHPVSLAFCQVVVNFTNQLLHLPDEAQSNGAACIALCEEHGIEWERAWVSASYGWGVAAMGQVDEGISIIRSGLDLHHRKGSEVTVPQSQGILAESLWSAGRVSEALQAAEDGLAVSQRTGDTYCDAELWRLKGQLLESQEHTALAESCFRRAITIARQQSALSLELRAATSLGRLWLKQGKRSEAERLVSNVYGMFSEGFETQDLREAQSLLTELRFASQPGPTQSLGTG